MPVVVHRIASKGDGVESVATGRARDFLSADSHSEVGWRGPHVSGEVLVRVVNTGVYDADDVEWRSCGDVPRLRGVNVSARIRQILQVPHQGEVGVVRNRLGYLNDIVRLNLQHVGTAGEGEQHCLNASARRMEPVPVA